MISIASTSLAAVVRNVDSAQFDFVAQATRDGSVYQIGNDGYFVVAPERGLLPKFVIDLRLPEICDIGAYPEIVSVLNSHSSGFLWYDSVASHAFDLVWRMRLPLKASAPLFEGRRSNDVALQKLKSDEEQLSIAVVSKDLVANDESLLPIAKSIFLAKPIWEGGQSLAAIYSHIENERLISLRRGNETVGSAITTRLPDGGIVINGGGIVPAMKGKGLEQSFLQLLRDELVQGKDASAYFSIDNRNVEMHRIALNAGFRLARQSYVAQLGSIG